MKYLVVILSALALASCSVFKPKPKLIVLISVDQMKGDYLDSFRANFDFGFKQLKDKGVVYKNANHFHSNTTTAAGHAAISTGMFPSRNGIVGNDIYNRNTNSWEYSIKDTGIHFVGIDTCKLEKVSAKNLLSKSFGDWMKMENSGTKTYSVALKDRSSILLGGQNANSAFWFDAHSTQMVSSDYYKSDFPEWVRDFSGKKIMANEIAEGWELSSDLITISTTTGDSIETENGKFYPWFPHNINTFNKDLVKRDLEGNFLWRTPFGDQFVLKFSEQLIINEKIGKGKTCDVLTIGLSAADYIGHHFGPNSLEVLDYYNKLDEYLGDYVQFLDNTIGRKKYVLILTADHGVAQLPEVAAEQGKDAVRISDEAFGEDLKFIDQSLQGIFNLKQTTYKKTADYGIEPDFNYLTQNNIDSVEYVTQLIYHLKSLSYVTEVYSDFDIRDSNCTKMYINEVRNSYYPNKNMFVYILGKPNYLVSQGETGTTHGTPYTYDTHVPLVFFGNKLKAKIIEEKVYTVDISPTILKLLQIEPQVSFDGNNILK